MASKKEIDHLSLETDGSFFDDMHEMEKQVMRDLGDAEGLAYLEEQEKKRNQETDDDEE